MIFVRVYDLEVRVHGDTYPLQSRLGMNGLGLKFHRPTKEWRGKANLKNLLYLQELSGAILSPDALEMIEEFQVAAARRRSCRASSTI